MAWEPDYITLNEFKHYLKIDVLDVEDDAELALDITAGSRAVDRYCSGAGVRHGLGAFRQFGQVESAEARYYTPRWDSCLTAWVIEIDDLASTTGLAILASTGNDRNYISSITTYVPRPMNALANNRVYTQLLIPTSSSIQPDLFEESVKVTSAHWGWNSVPDVVKRATLIQAHRINKRRTSPLGKSGSPQKGTQQNVLEDIDVDVVEMLKDYVRLGRTL